MGNADAAHKEESRGKTGENEDGTGEAPHGGTDGASDILLVLLPSQLDSIGFGKTKGTINVKIREHVRNIQPTRRLRELR